MTQLIDKNKLLIDEIRFNNDNEIILYKDKDQNRAWKRIRAGGQAYESGKHSFQTGREKWNPGSVGLFGKQWKRNI